MERQEIMDVPDLFALIVGIDRTVSPKLRTLDSCLNDARLVASTLRNHFHVPQDHIVMLTNDQATRKGIRDAFQSHLVDRARARNASPDPSRAEFLFHFSGHGSTVADQSGTQPDGLDETILSYEGRCPGVHDIRAWELAQW
ncbi:MAG: caspase family protein, partial [Pirellulales bacterium]|nr:caspase family protein [Pirellulales bacterium]